MFRTCIAMCVGLVVLCVLSSAFGQVRVHGYVRKDGTYVAPHYRSSPNSSKSDNYSTRGNYNPYTGKAGTAPASHEIQYVYPAYRAATFQPEPIYQLPSLTPTRSLPPSDDTAKFLCVDAVGGQHLIDYPRAGCTEIANTYSQNRLSNDAIRSCSDAKVPECQHRYAEILEKKGDAGSLRQARTLFQSAFERGYDPAGVALLRILREHTDTKDQSEADIPAAAYKDAESEPVADIINEAGSPASVRAPTAISNGPVDDAKSIAWPDTRMFKSCFSTNFTIQTKGRTVGKPSTWVSKFRTVSTAPTSEKYIFCFPERGVNGSAMYANGAWLYFRRNQFGQLHGDVVSDAGNRTRFIYFQATGQSYSPVEGASELYVALNADKAPDESVSFNVIVLQGWSTQIEIPSQ